MSGTSSILDTFNVIRKGRDLAAPTKLALHLGEHNLMSQPVALAELLAADVTPTEIVTALRRGEIATVSRHVYAERDGIFLSAFGVVSPTPYLFPAPTLYAEALARQYGWKLAIGSELAAFLCGLLDRPLFPTTVGYDQNHNRHFGAGLQMEPVSPALTDWPVAAQILVRGLGRRIDGATAEGLARHGQILGRMKAWRILLADQLGPVLDVLSEPLRIVALGIREQARACGRDGRAVRGIPLDWQPPAPAVQCARIENWYLDVVKDGSGTFEALRGRCLDHPTADPSRSNFRSSPVLWIDEDAGWARAESRIYRLGQKRSNGHDRR